MRPAELPADVRENEGLQAEAAVFDALRDSLEDRYTVFHSLAWKDATRRGDPAQDREADFVVCHPDLGVMVVEVKGGIVAYDPDTREWSSTSRSGHVSTIKDPFRQARDTSYGLERQLRKMVSQSGSLRVFHAVCFPHCAVRAADLPGDGPPEIVFDAEGLREIGARIERAFAFCRQGAELRGPGLKEIIGALQRLHGLALEGRRDAAIVIAEHQREFDRLTASQGRVLDMVASNKRLLVHGCAGSGKTFLAKRLAVKRAGAGERVLVLCFNEMLGSLLHEDLADFENLTATNFHHACELFARAAGLRLNPLVAERASDYYDSLPDVAFETAALDPDLRFDTIVVDEAQDFEPDWWALVDVLLAPGGSVCVFTDSNQLLYGPDRGVLPSPPGPFAEVALTENIRNTQQIHKTALRFFEGASPTALGPEGESPRWIPASSFEDQLQKLEEVLDRLLREQHIEPADIVVLTPKGAASTELQGVPKVAGRSLVPYENRQPRDIGWSTVRKFKGLESPVVVLMELDWTLVVSQRMRELAYVGVTRARDYLWVIGEEGALGMLREPR
ncbi:MAG: NERD domain-containing protein [Fimbriimonadaceae bacterium]|nr:NERD domain-containing protein [Fimbriimonadaceae bacterium]